MENPQELLNLADRIGRLSPDLDESERLLFAQSFLSTPTERLNRSDDFLRSLNLYTYSDQKRSGFKLPE